MIKQEIENDRLDKDNEIEEEGSYQNMIINNFEKYNVDRNISQMEQRSILSNVINYIQYDRNPSDYFKLNIKAPGEKNHRKEDRQIIELDFGDTPDKLKKLHKMALD